MISVNADNALVISDSIFASNKKQTFKGKSISISNSEFSGENNEGLAVLTATDDVTIKDTVINFVSTENKSYGTFYMNNSGDVVFENVKINSVNDYDTVGFTGNPKSLVFKNCEFLGTTRNVTVNTFSLQDNCSVTFDGCHFEKCSEPFRFDNDGDNTGITLNFRNCVFDEWEASTSGYNGMIMFQDTKNDSKTLAEAIEANLFSKDKITINVYNCIYNGQKIECKKPSDVFYDAPNNDSQLAFVYLGSSASWSTLLKYSEHPDNYPKINIM